MQSESDMKWKIYTMVVLKVFSQMRSMLEMISKERKGGPSLSTRDRRGREVEKRTVSVQTDFPAQLLESYVVKHKARFVQNGKYGSEPIWFCQGAVFVLVFMYLQGAVFVGLSTEQQHKSQPLSPSPAGNPSHPPGYFQISKIIQIGGSAPNWSGWGAARRWQAIQLWGPRWPGKIKCHRI